MLDFDLTSTLLRLFVLTISLSFHEAAHAWMAFKLGDDTAQRQGRLTLNPMAHFDIIGSLMIIFAPIGWAKPVPVDPRNLGNPRRDMSLVALAGPVSNFILGFAGCLVFAVLAKTHMDLGWYRMLSAFIQINFALAVFNLLPVFPLDGSKALSLVLSEKASDKWEDLIHRWGLYPLIAIILLGSFPGGGPLGWWFALWQPILNPIGRLFGVYNLL
jgi:Zn-dependent protease